MRSWPHQVGWMSLNSFDEKLYIKSLAEEVKMDFRTIRDIRDFGLDTQEFIESVSIANINYDGFTGTKSDIWNDIDFLLEYFMNCKQIKL